MEYIKGTDITDNTITVAIDTQGGLCDRVMLGRKGILHNANATIECYNDENDEERIEPFNLNDITDLDVENAISYLIQDNFAVLVLKNNTIVTDDLVVGRNITILEPIGKSMTVVDVEKIEDWEDNIYRIF